MALVTTAPAPTIVPAEPTASGFAPRELNLFWGRNYLVTIHRRTAAVLALLEEARRRWEQHEGRQEYGVACLAYTLFESLVDGYFAVQDRVRERIERIEEAIFLGDETAAAGLFRLAIVVFRLLFLLFFLAVGLSFFAHWASLSV